MHEVACRKKTKAHNNCLLSKLYVHSNKKEIDGWKHLNDENDKIST